MQTLQGHAFQGWCMDPIHSSAELADRFKPQGSSFWAEIVALESDKPGIES